MFTHVALALIHDELINFTCFGFLSLTMSGWERRLLEIGELLFFFTEVYIIRRFVLEVTFLRGR